MSAQFYVSPEQLMKDRADFARKGIARGRSVIVASCRDGIALIAENPSRTLRKIGEIYDRIGFAAVGKYNEFESLRQAGVRYADTRGYSYDREDVTGRGLASVYAQSLGAVFTAESKPFEVELAIAEVGEEPASDELYRVNFDGSISDEPGLVVMGGDARSLAEAMDAAWAGRELATAGFDEVIRTAAAALPEVSGPDAVDLLEVAVLERSPVDRPLTGRTFKRRGKDEILRALAGKDGA
ncbi:MAG: proteasome subunit alpha [Micrococcaceae bacterium]|uniref:proteasome subunit alpha n=1 Tax=Arthrobacter sp. 179 TaxID=3457734 RepID=UPI00264D37A2|nr:proteasome subunit alpha [Micrococcaceae bacterium]MDN5823187.1 proteasome subunit alpha [Micrococcaceae bacterium]MDN5878259.1 proteasome subunit alpha [Micrococcaceae bacterium]MDN5885747.1 proteasome subunit alpha [Micrococcaceae bacterium]MDN5904396.1 proteasome subunit alpha [Micrococcaceae bacterium]